MRHRHPAGCESHLLARFRKMTSNRSTARSLPAYRYRIRSGSDADRARQRVGIVVRRSTLHSASHAETLAVVATTGARPRMDVAIAEVSSHATAHAANNSRLEAPAEGSECCRRCPVAAT